MFISEEEIEHKKQPFNIVYNGCNLGEKDNTPYRDSGLIFNNSTYEIRINIRTYLKFSCTQRDKSLYKDEDPKLPYWEKYYFVTIKNTQTQEQKRYTCFEDDYL